MKIKRILLLAFIGVGAIYQAEAKIKPIQLKVAVLDQLQSQKLSSQKYESDYFEGIEFVVAKARRNGIHLEYKYFSYDRSPLAILKAAQQVKEWRPNFIIGPRFSNDFLLLKDQFKDILVVSPFATAFAVSQLPQNFYSITLPNEYATQAMVNFVLRDFPNRGVYAVLESSCKNCIDFASQFKALLQKRRPEMVIKQARFSDGEAEKADLKKLMKGYEHGDLILVPNTSYTSGVLIPRIAEFLEKQDLIFLGGDGWGSWQSGYVGKVKSKYRYVGYRLTPWSLNGESNSILEFKTEFKKFNSHDAPDVITFVAARALSSIVDALKVKDVDRSSLNKSILEAFKKARKANPHWYRNEDYNIFQVTQEGETYVGSISPHLKN